ncbi:MAG: 50S ribosomal protein L31 [bacterium]|nr:50S ribosomal protein L31 [bacterium]
MKKEIHPKYFKEAKVSCVCGNSFSLGSTKESLAVEVCSVCHPFYTGKEKTLDRVGQVQKFRKRLEKRAKLA